MNKLSKIIIGTMWLITTVALIAFIVSAKAAEVVTTWKCLAILAVCSYTSFYGTVVILIIEAIRKWRNNRNDNSNRGN